MAIRCERIQVGGVMGVMLSRSLEPRVLELWFGIGRSIALQRKFCRTIPITIGVLMSWRDVLWPVEHVGNETMALPGPLRRLSFELRRTLNSPE